MSNYLVEVDTGFPERKDVYCQIEDEIEKRRLLVLMALDNIDSMTEHLNYNQDMFSARTFLRLTEQASHARFGWSMVPSPSDHIPNESLCGAVINTLLNPRRSSVFTMKEAERIENTTSHDNRDDAIKIATARAKASYASGHLSLSALIEDLEILADTQSFAAPITLSPDGIIKNGIGLSKSANLIGSRLRMKNLKETMPAGSLPEGITHAAHALKITRKPGASVPTVVNEEHLVVGYVKSRKFIPVASILPDSHPVRQQN